MDASRRTIVNPRTGRQILTSATTFAYLVKGPHAEFRYDESDHRLIRIRGRPTAYEIKMNMMHGLPTESLEMLLTPLFTKLQLVEPPQIVYHKSPPGGGSVFHAQGKRPDMEDTAVVATRGDWYLYAVMDGHGGKHVSEALQRDLCQWILPHLTHQSSVKDIQSLLVRLDEHYWVKHRDHFLTQGSTCTMLLQHGPRIWVVNIGDSRTLVFTKSGELLLETSDHKPARERERIEMSGGYVAHLDTDRVNGNLAVSRAFGDFYLKKTRLQSISSVYGPVCVVPDVYELDLSAKTEEVFAILACDGLFDVMSSEQVVRQALTIRPDEAASVLGNEALQRGTTDNVSVMFVNCWGKVS